MTRSPRRASRSRRAARPSRGRTRARRARPAQDLLRRLAPASARPTRCSRRRSALRDAGRRRRRRRRRDPRPRRDRGAARGPRGAARARASSYRDRALEEFDLDAALARKPALLLVDELAHTNAPGSRHPKRWQDVRGAARRRHRRLHDGQRPAPREPERRRRRHHRHPRARDACPTACSTRPTRSCWSTCRPTTCSRG